MVVKTIYLFNTELDINNNNVLCPNGETTKFNYYRLLEDMYGSYVITEDEIVNKGVNFDSNKGCAITIKETTFNTVKDIIGKPNYIILTDGNEMYFGFIETYTQVGNNIVTFFIKYDVWSNNIDEISKRCVTLNNNNQFDIDKDYGIVKRGHYVSYKEYSDDKVQPIIYNLDTPKVDNYVHSISYPLSIRDKSIGIDYNILYLKIITSEELTTSTTTFQHKFGTLPIYYAPIGLRNCNTGKYEPFSFRVRQYVGSVGDTTRLSTVNMSTLNDLPDISSLFNSDFFEKISTKIISASFTFYPPILEPSIYNKVVDYSTELYTAFSVYESVDDETVNNQLFFIYDKQNNDKIIRDLTINSIHTKENIKSNELNRNYFKDGVFDYFPFTFKEFMYPMNNKVIYNNSNYYDSLKTIYKRDTDTMGIQYGYYNHNNVDNIKYQQLNFDRLLYNNEVSFSVDSLQYYLQTKGAQTITGFATSYISNSVHNLTKKGGNIYSMLLGNIDDGANFASKMYDVENTPDTAKRELYRGEIDLDFCDLIVLMIKSFDTTTPAIKSFENLVHYFGYLYNSQRNPFGICRRYFDYISMEEVVISFGDNYDREMLKNLFSRGFTKNYYIVNNGLHISPQTISIINKNVNNYDMWLREE